MLTHTTRVSPKWRVFGEPFARDDRRAAWPCSFAPLGVTAHFDRSSDGDRGIQRQDISHRMSNVSARRTEDPPAITQAGGKKRHGTV